MYFCKVTTGLEPKLLNRFWLSMAYYFSQLWWQSLLILYLKKNLSHTQNKLRNVLLWYIDQTKAKVLLPMQILMNGGLFFSALVANVRRENVHPLKSGFRSFKLNKRKNYGFEKTKCRLFYSCTTEWLKKVFN